MLANETLPRLNADKRGTLAVTIRDVRNVLPPPPSPSRAVAPEEEDEEGRHEEEEEERTEGDVDEEGENESSSNNHQHHHHHHNHQQKKLRFLVEVLPGTAVATEEGEDQVEVEEVGGTASFPLLSLEAKIVVHFGPRLEHYVKVPLHNRYKESELSQLSDWHASAAVQEEETETETPGVEDLTGVPAVQLLLKFHRKNKEEVAKVTDKLKSLQEEMAALGREEGEGGEGEEEGEEGKPAVARPAGIYRGVRGAGGGSGGGSSSSSKKGKSGGIRSVDDEDEDEEEDEEEYGEGGMRGRALSLWRWVVMPVFVVVRVGRRVGGLIWHRRAIFMFIGGTLFFHFRGEDLAV